MAPAVNLAKVLLEDRIAAGYGSALAIVAYNTELSYSDLWTRVDRAGHTLRAAGVSPGDRVLLRLPNSAELVAAWLAVQKIGATAVTTSTELRARELAHIVSDAHPAICVVDPCFTAEVDRAGELLNWMPQILTSSELSCREEALESDVAAGTDHVPATIAYTSGLDPEARGACHFPDQILAAADAYAGGVLRLTASDVIGGVVPLAFSYGLGALLVFPLRFGAAVVLDTHFHPERLLSAVEAHRITVLFGTATCYRLLLRIPNVERRFDLKSLRICVSAGEPLEREVTIEWMRRTGVDLVDGFGTTEMFHVFLSSRPGAIVPGSVGVPVPGYEVRLVDEHLVDVPTGTPGLLAVRGPTGCRYWQDGGVQIAARHDGWRLTGDRLVKDRRLGYLFCGRADQLIVSAGYNVSPAEVERVLLSHPAIEEAAVLGVPDPVRHRIVAAAIVARPRVRPSADFVPKLHAHVQTQLAAFKCPRRYEIISALPRTLTGSIDRRALECRLAT
jgi:2-aminobenzoate-CoA ligase